MHAAPSDALCLAVEAGNRNMVPRSRGQYRAEDERDADRQTASLAAIAVTLVLLILGLLLVRELAAESKLEDCLLAGRRNCDLLVAPHP